MTVMPPARVRPADAELKLLAEVLERMAGRTKAQLDLKEIGYERRVIDLAHHHLGPGNALVCSLEEPTVRAVKDDFPQLPAGLVLGRGLSGLARLTWPKVRLEELRPLHRLRRRLGDRRLNRRGSGHRGNGSGNSRGHPALFETRHREAVRVGERQGSADEPVAIGIGLDDSHHLRAWGIGADGSEIVPQGGGIDPRAQQPAQRMIPSP